jgi:hypothetical protein
MLNRKVPIDMTYYQKLPSGPQDNQIDVSKEEEKLLKSEKDPPNEEEGFFIDRANGVFMTFKYRELKRNVCRSFMRFLLILAVAVIYIAMWSLCDICVLGIAVGSCMCSCMGCGFMSFNCFAGILASLIKGFRIGSELAAIDVHWKI